ncbi:putative pilus assembly protein FilE [Acinetobacter modestus]|uniref:putative pilus assembly protein FilE n=1 Tax=Acinetobacter modestus TaxID=1776740 RepID=UPI001F4ACD0A|nr:putative pilus assembly protein FilE [Acinetobacter modestus]MCH7328697.1 putative pilus assembly protein FilE [Acinetobacter modestus]
MQKKMMNRSKFAMLSLFIAMVSESNLYADGFYTIIGPDGRPMIVPKRISKDTSVPIKKPELEEKSKSSDNSSEIKQSNSEKDLSIVKIETHSNSAPLADQKNSINQKDVVIQAPLKNNRQSITKTTQSKKNESIQVNIQKEQQAVISNNIDMLKHPQVPSAGIKQQSEDNSINQVEQQAFSKVDGVEYVNSEYLEDQEFNLEGKKRFYSMPDGTGRLETIERKKGVSRSVLDKFINKAQQSNAPISLSTSYIRLSADELAIAFEKDRCFVDGYSKSIKTLTAQKEVGLWPRKPLKEKFEYELVKLDNSIQFMQIESYAATNEKPNYYWPLVIFLNEKGCIQEGVSGFKNAKTTSTLFQHSSLQGTLKVPSNAYYMMLTPLASAVDVSEEELSNQGQVRISVLQ